MPKQVLKGTQVGVQHAQIDSFNIGEVVLPCAIKVYSSGLHKAPT